LESPWWFGRFPADIHILVETSSISVDETIEAEWKRLQDEEGIDLGIALAPAEVVISVDEEGNPKTEGLRQVFQEGEIYQHDGEAYALYGPILRKYKQWGGLGSYVLGFPISPIQPVTSSLGTEGMMVQLEGHSDWPPSAIYSSTKSIAATWPWIGAVYSEDLGGHTGWLGFPLTDEQDYEHSTLQMFERGYIVYYIPRVGEDRDWTRPPVAYPYLTSLGTFFDVRAQQWQDTGIQVEEGDLVSTIQVDGSWTNGGPTQNWFDANGNPDEEPQEDALLPSAPIGALIGKVGQDGPAFLVGRWAVFPVEAGGTLYLAMNDTSYTTNDGRITVEISVEPTE
jgi:hypothetical protein